MKTLKTGETLHCPTCGESQEGPVEDFVIPGRTGDRSQATEACNNCDAQISVTHVGDGSYTVELADEE